MKKNRSAKDIAFDREREKYRKEIRDRDTLITELRYLVKQLEESVRERDNKISECNDWIRRLLEYMDLSEDDMKEIIQKDKDMVEVSKRLLELDRLVSVFFYGGR